MAFKPAQSDAYTFKTSHGSGNQTFTETVAADRIGVLEALQCGSTVACVVDVTIGGAKVFECELGAASVVEFTWAGGIYSGVLGEDIVVTATAAAGSTSINGKFR